MLTQLMFGIDLWTMKLYISDGSYLHMKTTHSWSWKDMADLDDLLLGKLRGIAEGTIKHTAQNAVQKGFQSKDCQAIFNGLTQYLTFPGVSDLREKLRQWMTDHAKNLAVGDLLELSKVCEKMQVASPSDMDLLGDITTRCHKLTVPSEDDDFQLAVHHVILAGLRAVLAQATWLYIMSTAYIHKFICTLEPGT